MATKHQGDCYRTFDGVKWPNLCDVLSPEQEQDVWERKRFGQRIKIRKRPDGYKQAFIHPNDLGE